jgi:hypothetical protein
MHARSIPNFDRGYVGQTFSKVSSIFDELDSTAPKCPFRQATLQGQAWTWEGEQHFSTLQLARPFSCEQGKRPHNFVIL